MSDEQTESTSAALARVTAELATERDKRAEDIAAFEQACIEQFRAEQERDAALAKRDQAIENGCSWMRAAVTAQDERDGYRAYIDEIKAELAEAISVRNALAGQLSEGMRGGMWIVARDGGYECDRCGRGIRRGEAYELLPATDSYQHVHCRDED